MYNNEDYEDEEQTSGSSGSVLKNFYNNNKKLIIVLVVIIGFVLLLSIISKIGGGSNNTNGARVSIQYNGNDIETEEVSIGYSIKLNAIVDGAKGNNTVEWSSSNESIATVNDGLVIGVSLGKTVITAVYNNGGKPVSDTCEITVYDGSPNVKLTNVSFPEGDILMGVGNTYNLNLTLEPARGYVTDKTFRSLDTSIVTVDDSGKLTALKTGTTTVKVSVNDGAFEDNVNVYVVDNVTSAKLVVNANGIQFPSTVEKIKINQEYQLVYELDPINADASLLKWTSSDTSVATVREGGVVTGIKEGSSWIRAYSLSGKEVGYLIVEIEKNITYVDRISLSDQSLSLNVGDSRSVIVTITPDDASNKSFTVSSNNSSVATVSLINGGFRVTGNSAGTAVITITSTDGKASQTMVVNVGGSQNGSGGNSGSDDGEDSCSTTYIRVRSDKGNVEKSYSASRNSYAKGPVKVTVEMDCGLSKVEYCYGKYSDTPCTPNTIKKDSFSFSIPDGDLYLIRIIKYDSDGDIVDSSSENYDSDSKTLSYYVNTKEKGANIQAGGSSGGSSGSSTNTGDFKIKGCQSTLNVGKAIGLESTSDNTVAVTWDNGDRDEIATVNSSGRVVGVGPGKVTITATRKSDGAKATCTIEVKGSGTGTETGISEASDPNISLSKWPDASGDGAAISDGNYISISKQDNVYFRFSADTIGTLTVSTTGNVTAYAPSQVNHVAQVRLKITNGSGTVTFNFKPNDTTKYKPASLTFNVYSTN